MGRTETAGFLLFLISLILIPVRSMAQDATTVSTFHCLSVYWSPSGGGADKEVLVEYRAVGADEWRDALAMRYNPIDGCGDDPETGLRYDKADYRGSIVHLSPATSYDIRLTLAGTTTTTTVRARTWSEEFPVGETVTPGDITTQLTVSTSGTPNGYRLIDGTGSTIDIQDNSGQCIYLDTVEYVIIRGFTLINGGQCGIRLHNCRNIVIEDCDISQWGEEDVAGSGFGRDYRAGIMAYDNSAVSCVFQRNRIHNPKWDTNSWAELHDPSESPDDYSNYHPSGPQGISLSYCYGGNNVIRYNEIWSDTAHYFNDVLGYGPNGSYSGFPGPDSDIYGNYLANCFDDGIESEGSNTNARIWGNYIDEAFIAIANAATSIGPLYVWRNVSGRAYSHPGSVYGLYGGFMKMGYAGSIDWMTGHMYVFNNTVLQPGGEGFGGLGTSDGNNRYVKHCVTRNNIFHVRDATTNSISIRTSGNEDNDYDYDLLNHPWPQGHEDNGIEGEPVYAAGSPIFDFAAKTGNFELSSSSPGYDAGLVIPNFCDSYNGAKPDMGAHEAGTPLFTYGVDAHQTIPVSADYGNGDERQFDASGEQLSGLSARINHALRHGQRVSIAVCDLSGRPIEMPVSEILNAVAHSQSRSSILSIGMYLLRVEVGRFRLSKRMMYLR